MKSVRKRDNSMRRPIIGIVFAIILFFAVFASGFVLVHMQEKSALKKVDKAVSGESVKEQKNDSSNNNSGENELSKAKPITPKEAYSHAKIVSKVKVESSKDNLTESDVIKMLKKRGFKDVIVKTPYELDGTYHDDKKVSEGSSKKHPIYQAEYTAKNGDYWILNVFNGQIMASPLSHNIENDGTEALISEKKSVMSYDSGTNCYYEIISDGTKLDIKVIKHITAETLDDLSSRGVDSL